MNRPGLYYLRARYYDPTTAQFMSVDPLAPITRAAYSYAADSPLNAIDPAGLSATNIGNSFSATNCSGVVASLQDQSSTGIDWNSIWSQTLSIAGGVLLGIVATTSVVAICAATVAVGCVVAVAIGGAVVAGLAAGSAAAATNQDIGQAASDPWSLANGAFGGIIGYGFTLLF